MPNAYTLNDLVNLVKQAKHPRTIYLSERDFEQMFGRVNAIARQRDKDGEYFTLITTRVRPKIHILDLSDSSLTE